MIESGDISQEDQVDISTDDEVTEVVQTREKGGTLSDTVRTYVEAKTDKSDLQKEMTERAVEVAM